MLGVLRKIYLYLFIYAKKVKKIAHVKKASKTFNICDTADERKVIFENSARRLNC